MKICFHCNKTYSDEFEYCHECGRDLESITKYICPRCESVIDKAFSYCPYCGCELNNEEYEKYGEYEDIENFNDIEESDDGPVDLGLKYYWGIGVSQDFEKAFTFFSKAADQNNSDAQYYVGMMYENGEYVPLL